MTTEETPWIKRKTTIIGLVLCSPVLIAMLATGPPWVWAIAFIVIVAIIATRPTAR